MKYVIKHKVKGYWEEEGDCYSYSELLNNKPSEPRVYDEEPQFTGLLDVNENPIFRLSNPIGFKT